MVIQIAYLILPVWAAIALLVVAFLAGAALSAHLFHTRVRHAIEASQILQCVNCGVDLNRKGKTKGGPFCLNCFHVELERRK
jgi:hypothetical protein